VFFAAKSSRTATYFSNSLYGKKVSQIRRRQPPFGTVLAHPHLLVRAHPDITARLGGTEEDESRLLVFRKIGTGTFLIDRPAEEPAGTGQTAALMTNRREHDPVPGRRIPEEVVPVAAKGALPLRRFQSDPVSWAFLMSTFDPPWHDFTGLWCHGL
jgi:hypothetical protein